MKSTLIILISIICCAQEYNQNEKVKIDMHGGNYNSFSSKSSFTSQKSSMMMFLDINSSKNKKVFQKTVSP